MGRMGRNKFHEGPGPSQRQLRVGETIRRALSDVLARGDVHDADLNRLSITVGEVRTSPDLKIATAYVLLLAVSGPIITRVVGHSRDAAPPQAPPGLGLATGEPAPR